MEQAPEVGAKVAEIIREILRCASGDIQFQIVVDDPAGNSFIQNPFAPQADPNMKVGTLCNPVDVISSLFSARLII
jgi:C4-type Zn-finger protein